MKNNVKRFLSVIMAMVLCVCFSVTAYARYVNDIDTYSSLSISGGKATLYSEMSGDSNITTVVMTHVLQKKSGSSYTDVSGTTKTRTFSNNNMPTMTDTVTVTDSGTYRIKATYKVTSKNGTDTHTAYSNVVTC